MTQKMSHSQPRPPPQTSTTTTPSHQAIHIPFYLPNYNTKHAHRTGTALDDDASGAAAPASMLSLQRRASTSHHHHNLVGDIVARIPYHYIATLHYNNHTKTEVALLLREDPYVTRDDVSSCSSSRDTPMSQHSNGSHSSETHHMHATMNHDCPLNRYTVKFFPNYHFQFASLAHLPNFLIVKKGVSSQEIRILHRLHELIQQHHQNHSSNDSSQTQLQDAIVQVFYISPKSRQIAMTYYQWTLQRYMKYKSRHFERLNFHRRQTAETGGTTEASNKNHPTIPFSLDEIKYWIRNLFAIISLFHREGIVHRDLKPANIFLHEKCAICLKKSATGEENQSTSTARDTTSSTQQPLDFTLTHEKVSMQQVLEQHFDSQRSHKIPNPFYHYECHLGDFEFAKELGEEELTKSQLGTFHFLSPEIVDSQSYSTSTDVWSIGVIMLEMLVGHDPLKYGISANMSASEVIERLSSQQQSFDLRKILEPRITDGTLNNEAISFMKGILDRNVSSRFSCQEALNHPFLKEKEKAFNTRNMATLSRVDGVYPDEDSNNNESGLSALNSAGSSSSGSTVVSSLDFTSVPSTSKGGLSITDQSTSSPYSLRYHGFNTAQILAPSKEFPHWFTLQDTKEWVYRGVLRSKSDCIRHTFFMEETGYYYLTVTVVNCSRSIWKLFRGVNLCLTGALNEEYVISESSRKVSLGYRKGNIFDSTKSEESKISSGPVDKLYTELSIRPENLIGHMIWRDRIEFELRLECL